MKAVFLDVASLEPVDLDMTPIQRQATGLQLYPSTSPEQLDAHLAGADIAIVNKVCLDAATLARHPQLRLICVAATGTNNVDLQAAAEQGIRVSNCQGYGTGSVVQHTLSLMLALATRLPDYSAAVKRGDWQRSTAFCLLDYPIMELQGKTLGIIGYGELGRGVARVAEALGMRVLIAARPGGDPQLRPDEGRVELSALLPQVDVLSLHCPLTDQSRNLIDAAALALMKPEALLINVARGGIVDEQALADALRGGRLGGAAVDVLTVEPPVQGNPLLFDDIPGLIVTPHCAWGSVEARQRMLVQIAENIAAFKEGAALRVVSA
ncbi:MAG: glycerate dehydrogenase [Motiliproteus sp.]|jgi:glycerate dehydrogenase